MAQYQYKAVSSSGEVLEGMMEAANQDEAVRELQAQEHIPILVEEARMKPKGRTSFKWRRSGIRAQDVDIAVLQLATLLKSGLSLNQALELLTELLGDRSVGRVLADLHLRVREGEELSAAMEQHAEAFPKLERIMVRAGEASGDLGTAFARIAEHRERVRRIREALASALIYPVILLVFAGISMGVVLGVVIPEIAVLFDDAHQELPMITQVVVATGEFIRGWWALIAGVLLAGGFYARWMLKTESVRIRWDRRLLDLPVAGPLLAKYETARFARVLGTLLQNGVDLLVGMGIASEAVANASMRQVLARASAGVRQGQGFAKSLRRASAFPKIALDLLQVGEKSGKLDFMLHQVADIYEHEVQAGIGRLMSMLGPGLILILALLIGTIVMSVLVAILATYELAF